MVRNAIQLAEKDSWTRTNIVQMINCFVVRLVVSGVLVRQNSGTELVHFSNVEITKRHSLVVT